MLSPGYLIVPPTTTKQNVTSHDSPSASNSVVYHQTHNIPMRCLPTIMPPPPNNILSTISNNNNNNNVTKCFGRSGSWNGLNTYSKETKNNKKKGNGSVDEREKEKEKQGDESGGSSKNSPENKGIKRVREKNLLSNNQTPQPKYYSPNHQNNNTFNHYFAFFSPNQRIGDYNKPYFVNRSNNRNKRPLVNQEGQTELVNSLLDRFLSRSNIVQIHGRPSELMKADELSCQIWDYYLKTQQSEDVYKNKIMLWKYLYTSIRNIFPRYGLFLVGSTMSGFGTNTSDVDMCLLVRTTYVDQRSEALFFLEQIKKALSRCDFVEHIELICAKVPILKFRDGSRNLDVDLNCNNCVGIRNTHLLHCYASLDWRVRALVLVVKMWARSNNINDAKTMTISSYSLALMVIHFLQCGVTPPVIPCLHGLYPVKFHSDSDIHTLDMQEQLNTFKSDNHQSLGELLLGFLHYYVIFPYNMYAISIRLGAKIPIEECRMARSQKNDPHQWKYLCIEEPFDLTNTARSVYDPEVFEKIKGVFIDSFNKLHGTRNLVLIFNIDDMKNNGI